MEQKEKSLEAMLEEQKLKDALNDLVELGHVADGATIHTVAQEGATANRIAMDYLTSGKPKYLQELGTSFMAALLVAAGRKEFIIKKQISPTQTFNDILSCVYCSKNTRKIFHTTDEKFKQFLMEAVIIASKIIHPTKEDEHGTANNQ